MLQQLQSSSSLRQPLVRRFMAVAGIAAILFSFTGCGLQSTHPGQTSRFDGTAYDALTLAHGALASFRSAVAADYPTLVPSYNRVVDTYTHAVEIYGLYRTSRTSEADSSLALAELVTSIAVLEADIQTTFHIALTTHQARALQKSLSPRASGSFSIDALLNELQLAATLAAAITGDAAQVRAANVILQATQEALLEYHAAANKPIDLGTLGNLQLISVPAAQ